MNAFEWRATGGLAAVYAVRMLGLFMILPVFALYARGLPGVTPFEIGLALGAYGLTQALLQIPFGLLSDRWGRKPLIIAGLLIFAGGSALAAGADSIGWIIAGRALQGAGAIAAVASALLADLTREAKRTVAMLVLGVGIGVSFTAAMVLGPVLAKWVGVPGIFALTALLAVACIPLVLWVVPAAPAPARAHRGVFRNMAAVLADRQLLRLDAGVFILHAILTALFVALPLTLADDLAVDRADHWLIYLPVMLASVALSLPLIQVGERRGHSKALFVAAVAVLAMAAGGLVWAQQGLVGVVLGLFAFFVAFNVLEASLPSLVSRVCPYQLRGAGMGVYSSSQFLGAFFGGALGGLAYQWAGATGVFAGAAVAALAWLVIAAGLRAPVARGVPAEAD